ncbi:MAG: hypothetical protein Q9224_000127 [Gallowayella concinna]
MRNCRLIAYATPHKGLQCRNASTTPSSSKPRVLEKPAKFYPPSHPQRLSKRTLPRQYPGPRLSQAQIEEQKVKKYPHMMPSEGTFMFWFLTHRWLHVSVLTSLAVITFVQDFLHTTVFLDMLPPGKEFWSHPLQFIGTYGRVYKLHTENVSARTAEKRKRKVDDVQKRNRYRKAHGLDRDQGLGGWTAKSDVESLGPAIPTGDLPGDDGSPKAGEDRSTDVDLVANKRRPVKRWLGIWE